MVYDVPFQSSTAETGEIYNTYEEIIVLYEMLLIGI